MLTTEAFGGHGGIAKYNRDFISALCAMPECREVVALPRLMPYEPGPLPTKLRYVLSGLSGKWRYAFEAVRAARGRYDLIVCSHINLLPVASLMKLWLRTPIVLLIYGIDAWRPHGSKFVNLLLRCVKAVISISEHTREKFCQWAPLPANRVHILPNAIDLAQYGMGAKNPVLLKRYGLTDKVVLMTLGRLSQDERYKGIDEVLELFPSLLKRYPNLVYLIVGDGTDRSRLEKEVSALGITGSVVFTGLIPESEKADHYRLADAYVMPGRGEGFGFVFLEAMACGIPVVASKLDGSREAVRNGELGIVVNPDDRAELEAGILRALATERQIPKGVDYFSYGNFAQRLRDTVLRVSR
jgi:glycosyltransferase involved in cell wall biosynthesis